MWITLPEDKNRQFHISQLIRYFIENRITEIMVGKHFEGLVNHHYPNSLDYWIRNSIAQRHNTMQATDDVITRICDTGLFERVQVINPQTNRECGGIRLVEHEPCIGQ